MIDRDKKKSGGLINEFLWICAGVDREVLRKCPSDYSKYAGMGGTILMTAILAMLSGGYALFVIFKSSAMAVLFGIFWGSLIFNLDRFIVSTMYTDGKHKISLKEILLASPRLAIAILLAVVISNPLELKIFEREIDYEIEQLKSLKANDDNLISLQNDLDELYAMRKSIDNDKIDIRQSSAADYNGVMGDKINETSKEIEAARKSVAQYDEWIRSATNQISKLERDTISNNAAEIKRLTANRSSYYSSRNNLNKQIDQLIQDKKAYENGVQTDMTNAIERLNSLTADNDRLIKLKEQEIAAYQSKVGAVAENYDGYAARLEAFSNVRKDKRDVNRAAWVIMILFMVIEIAPTLFKLMIAAGAYDDLLRSEKHRIKVLSDKAISDIENEVSTALEISNANRQKKIEIECENNENLLRAIADSQMEIMNQALSKWKEDQIIKANTHPELFIDNDATVAFSEKEK